jgi:hypothetical protein
MVRKRRSVLPERGAVDFSSTKIILRLSQSKSEKELRELGLEIHGAPGRV